MDTCWSSSAKRLGAFGALAVVATLLTACGSGGGTPAQVVSVNERDFVIMASPKVVDAGDVVFRDHNHGPDAHEMIVVRVPAKSGLRLPFRSDGLTVNEEELQHATVGALEPGEAGTVRELRVRLAPGRYVLFCNMAGHFMAGMETVVTVR